jgi:hypothetical protein
MSSHHFVKEGQEPALFILDPVDFELASPFLEWAPLVLVSGTSLDQVLRWGIKIDVVLGAESDEEIEQKVSGQAPVEVIRLKPEETFVSSAFDYLIDAKQYGVNVLTTRPENVFAEAEKVTRQLHVTVVDHTFRWVGISTGRFEKWLTMNTPIVIRKSVEKQSMEIQGLIERNGRFECLSEGMISIASDAFFWVAESHS